MRLWVGRRAQTGRFGRSYVAALCVVVLVSPALALAELITGIEFQSFAVVGLISVFALLVLRRLVAVAVVSERLHREIEEQNAQLAEVAAIVESSDDSITATALDGTITSWNPASERLYGYTAAEMIGRRIHEIVEPERHALVDETYRRIAGGTAIEPHEATGVRKDGTIIPVALTVSTVRDTKGTILGVATIARDVSERKTAEAERESLLAELGAQNERLLKLDRMKDEFIASVSHELRTPLTSIRGYLELVREDGSLDADQDRMLRIVDRNADRLLGLVTDLLFVAQIEAGQLTLHRTRVDVGAIAVEAIECARPRAGAADVALELDAGDGVVVDGDRTRLAQVLDNLISNAIKFTPSGGRVAVQVRREGSTASITVSDTGVGIPADERQHLFERFFRTSAATRSAVPGTGLGLAIVRAIAESHGGTVRAEDGDEGGSRFVVTLPAVRTADLPVAC